MGGFVGYVRFWEFILKGKNLIKRLSRWKFLDFLICFFYISDWYRYIGRLVGVRSF